MLTPEREQDIRALVKPGTYLGCAPVIRGEDAQLLLAEIDRLRDELAQRDWVEQQLGFYL